MLRRILRLLLGLYSHAELHRIMAPYYAAGFAQGINEGGGCPQVPVPPVPPLSWLDRWELRNARRATK